MHENEPDIDVSLVRRLLTAQFPHWAELPVTPVKSAGTSNAIFRLGDELAVRLPRIDWAVGDVDLEGRWLPWLAPRLPIPVPVPLAKGEPGFGYPWPWSVCRWVSGANPRSMGESELLAKDLAEFIHALWRIDATGGPPAGRGIPLADRDSDTRKAISELVGMIDTDAVTAAWDQAVQALSWDRPPVWLHGDLAPGNILVHGDRLSSVIDFGCMGVGDPAVDLGVAWNLLPAAARPVFREALAVDDATWERGRGWALSIALIQLPYYQVTNPVLAGESRYAIKEVLRAA